MSTDDLNIDEWFDDDDSYTMVTHNVWKRKMLQNEFMAMSKIEVITSDKSGQIISDTYRKSAFEKFDRETSEGRNLAPSATEYLTKRQGEESVFHFRKDAQSGEWYLWLDGVKYLRNRTLSIPYWDEALGIAVSKVQAPYRVPDVVDIHVGDIAFQFMRRGDWNKIKNFILVNSAHIPLPTIELTQEKYNAIIDMQTKDWALSYKPPERQQNQFWQSGDIAFFGKSDNTIQILNPIVIKSIKDYNMAKYRLRKSDELLIQVLDSGNTNVALLLGKPGTGKTFFTDCYAKRLGAEYMYQLCHDGTNAEDLFYSINVGKAVLREGVVSEEIYQAGLLLRAVRASHKHKVVLCVDEIDKASKRTENLFLDFAETYRVPFLSAQEVGVKENITIFFTSNGYRPHSEAFLRRCYRHHFDFLPRDVEISLIGGTYAEKIVDALTAIRKDGASSPSVKEGMQFAHNLQFAETKDDVELLFYAHLCKEEEDFEVLKNGNFADRFVKPKHAIF